MIHLIYVVIGVAIVVVLLMAVIVFCIDEFDDEIEYMSGRFDKEDYEKWLRERFGGLQ